MNEKPFELPSRVGVGKIGEYLRKAYGWFTTIRRRNAG